jgi:multiple sugar transport system substrate-binding protein
LTISYRCDIRTWVVRDVTHSDCRKFKAPSFGASKEVKREFRRKVRISTCSTTLLVPRGGVMMKKLFIFAILVLFFTVTVSAALAKVELTYWTHEDPNRTEIENKYIKEFEAANPGVTVSRVTSPSGKMAEKVLTAFAANRGPDMFNMEIEQEYAYIVNRRLAPVDFKAVGYTSDKAVYDAYLPRVLDPATFDGKLYGLPLELTNWCIYVNDRIFKSAGLDPAKDYPKTWEEMAQVSEKIVIREGQIIKRRGFDFRYPYYLVSMVPMVEQLGGALISDDGKKAIINDQAWIKFLTFMKEWGPNGKNLGSPTYTPARSLFNKDKNDVAMCESGLYQQGRIRQDNLEFYNSKEWRVIPYPVFKNAVKNVAGNYYGHYLVVNAGRPKENQQVAWKLIGYMLGHSEEYLSTVGLIQPTVKLMKSDTYKAMPYANVFKEDMERAHIVYYGENSAKIQDHIREAVESVMLAGASSEAALEKLKRRVQEALQER